MFSIITINFNNSRGLEKTLASIISQTNKDYEIIIIDGLSTDGFEEVIEKYNKHIAYCKSEKDRGISDAFNKGLAKATGHWVLFLNSGDILFDQSVLEKVSLTIRDDDLLILGCLWVINKSGQKLYKSPKSLSPLVSLPHQALFFNKLFFEKTGYYSESFKCAMDYDLLLRNRKIKLKTIDIEVSLMESDGISQTNVIKVHREGLASQLLNLNDQPVLFLVIIYFFRLFKSLIRVLLIKLGLKKLVESIQRISGKIK